MCLKKNVFRSTCLLLFLIIETHAGATIYYSRGAPGNWNANASWSTVTYGNATNTGTYPGASDTALIGNGYTIMVTSSFSVTSITVGQGTSGILQYSNASTYTVTVTGDITINSGGKFWYNNNSSKTHTLNLGGNFTNNGTVSFYFDANDRVNITFNSSRNSIVSGSGTWTLNSVTLNKSTLTTYTLDVQSNAFETAIVSLSTTQGTYIHNNSGTYSVNSASASNYTISSSVIFKVPQGTVTFSPNTATLNLQGSLYVNGGNVYVGTTAGTGGILYNQSGSVPYLEISSGTLTVYGAITNNAAGDAFNFMMSGGNMLVHCGSTGTNQDLFFMNDKSSSIFTMTGGTIIIQNHNLSGGPNVDFGLCGTNGTVTITGGTVQFGNSSTTNGTTFDFLPLAGVTQPNIKISGAASSGNKLMTTASSSTDFKFLSLYISAGTTFDIQSISGSAGNSKKMTLTDTYDGTNAFYNDGTFVPQTGTVIFGGSSAQQISGSTTTSFYDLTVNTSASVVLNKPVIVTDYLSMQSGKLISTTTNSITSSSTANADLGTSSSYVDGPMYQDVAQSTARTINFPIGSGAAWRPLVFTPTHSSVSSATYKAEVINSSAASLSYTLPASLSRVSSVRYWNLTRSGASNFSTATLKIYYGTDDGVTDYTSLRVAQAISPNWVDKGGTGSANGSGSITSGAFTTFSNTFTLGNSTGGANPLPITLLNFSAEKKDKSVLLTWSTVSEENNDYFSIERSADGEHFFEIARTHGSGNSSSLHLYSVVDNHPMIGINFYRLRQTDVDGRFTFFEPVKITYENQQDFFLSPNPWHEDYLDVHIKLAAHTLLKINICDSNGTLVYKKEILVEDKCDHVRLNDLNIPAKGLFILYADDGSNLYRSKLIGLKKQFD